MQLQLELFCSFERISNQNNVGFFPSQNSPLEAKIAPEPSKEPELQQPAIVSEVQNPEPAKKQRGRRPKKIEEPEPPQPEFEPSPPQAPEETTPEVAPLKRVSRSRRKPELETEAQAEPPTADDVISISNADIAIDDDSRTICNKNNDEMRNLGLGLWWRWSGF